MLFAHPTKARSLSDHPFRQNRINYPDETWKVAVVLEPGQTIADITENTRVIGIITPNSKVPSGLSVDELAAWRDWGNWRFSVDEIEEKTGLNLLSNIPQEIQNELEEEPDNGSTVINDLSSSLLSDESIQDDSARLENNLTNSLFQPVRTFDKVIFGNESSAKETSFSRSIEVFGSSKITGNQNSVIHFTPIEVGSIENSSTQNSIIEIGMGEIGSNTISSTQIDPTQIGMAKIGVSQVDTKHFRPTQISPTQIDITHVNPDQTRIAQVDLSQIESRQNSRTNRNFSKISFPSFILSEEMLHFDVSSFSFHNSTPEIINRLNNSATDIWSDLLQPQTQLDIDFQITDLPTGQLAEATITGFDENGTPNAGTILIDHNANGVGWFIDETPLDNSEFTAQDTDSYLLAAAESEANGKYDLLTTVLHELAHLYGFIEGYAGFDELKAEGIGQKAEVIIGDDFEATLDGEHLDKQAHPYDLLNTHFAPGMRKLPSELDVQILQALIATEFERNGSKPAGEELLAKLTSDPLLAIANGDFSISDTTTESFAWDTRGASGIEDGQAVLTEDSPFLSNFTQTFTVPEAAKTLQFTLVDTELGASELAPPDAFEVALLDANTQESLATEIDLTETDSLLNIQNDGTAYFSDKVRIGGASSGEIINLDKSRTITVDISDLAPGTEATLYFDLLGFGEADSRIVIDDVRLSDQNLLPPVAADDTATTTQGQPVIIDILSNDSDDDGTIATDSVQIQTEPENGSAIVRSDGTVSYIPGTGFAGTDSFTYVVQDNDGQLSNPATVSITVDNAAPTITEVQIPDRITEGREFELGAIAPSAVAELIATDAKFGGQIVVE